MTRFATRVGQEFIECVASFDNYREAEQAVDYLADRKFAVESISIVAEGLRYVEKVTGRLTWLKAIFNNGFGGAVVGILLGFIFGMLDVMQPLVSGIILGMYGGILGFLLGACFGLVSFAFSKGTRDFTAYPIIDAAYYNVMVHTDYADGARRLLQEEFGPQHIKSAS